MTAGVFGSPVLVWENWIVLTWSLQEFRVNQQVGYTSLCPSIKQKSKYIFLKKIKLYKPLKYTVEIQILKLFSNEYISQEYIIIHKYRFDPLKEDFAARKSSGQNKGTNEKFTLN